MEHLLPGCRPFFRNTLWTGLGWVLWAGGLVAGDDLAQVTPDYSRLKITTHNMSQDNTQQNMCGYCHTPVYSGGSLAPTWQAIALDPFYQDGDRQKLGGNRTAGPASLLCLFCHDKEGVSFARAGNTPTMGVSHPVGIPFKGVVYETDIGNLDYGVAHRGKYGGTDVWWVETDRPGFQEDDILLFPRQLADGRVVPFVECSSCHNPHSPNPNFIRITDTGRLCYACHPNM